MVDNISIPNTFFTVQTGVNDSLYIAEKHSTTITCRKVTLDQNYYTSTQFAAELALKLNVGTPTSMGTNPYTALVYTSARARHGHWTPSLRLRDSIG